MASSAWASLSDEHKAVVAFGLAMLSVSDPDGQAARVAVVAAKLHLTKVVAEFVSMLNEPITKPQGSHRE